MSLLWPSRTAILIDAKQLSAVVRGGLLGKIAASSQLAYDSGAFPQERFTQLLESLKPGKSTRLSVVLAAPWVRYTLTPAVHSWLNPQEAEALARQVFVESYGEAARQWAIQHQLQAYGAPAFACAAEPQILDSIKQSAQRFDIKQLRILPLLAVAWNHAHGRARGLPWFALAEPTQLTLIHQQRGNWLSLALQGTGDQFATEFDQLLDRESTRTEERNLRGSGVNLSGRKAAAANWLWLGSQERDAGLFWAAKAAQ